NETNAKYIGADERESLRSLKRGVFAREAVAKGSSLSPDKVFFAMPCQGDQTTSSEYQDTMIASEDYPALAPLREERQASTASNLRSLIHEAKGMLYEAKITTGKEYNIEMSHHY